MSYVAAPRRTGFPAAWWGIAMVIASEATLMACFVATYYYLRIRAVEWPPPGIPEPRVVVPLVLAGVLASTSIPMYLAARAGRAGRVGRARLLLVVALLAQAGYFAYEVQDFSDQLKEFTPQTNAYGSIYYTLLGAEHTHVAVGILMSAWLVLRLFTGLTRYRLVAVRAIAFYWYAVSVISVVVALCIVSAAL